MSGSLLEVKKQIGGVNNTRKITKAMQLVAASKMRQFQKRALKARSYVADLYQVLENNKSVEKSVYTEKRQKATKTLFVIYTSDKGLCGALNNKLINGLFRSDEWNSLAEKEKMLITIGKKSYNFAQSNKIKVEKKFIGISEKLSNLDAISVVDHIIKLWKDDKDIKEVIFISPHYKNSFTFYPVMKTFLPLQKPQLNIEKVEKEIKEVNLQKNNFMIFSPDQETVLNALYEQIIQAAFIEAFLELKASEYSSRMMAMQNATDAADKMIVELKRKYNKARQQAITQEIAELIGASKALEEE